MAGDGGESLPQAQALLDATCRMVGITNCPQLPTVNQVVVEIAALDNTSPGAVRSEPQFGLMFPPGLAVDGGSHGTSSNIPLAFISPPNKTGTPIPTVPSDPAANSLILATNTGGTLDLNFSYLARTNSVFTAGQDVADITLPFVESDANGNPFGGLSAIFHISATGGTNVTAQVIGDFTGAGTGPPQIYTPSQLGMTFSIDFSSGHEVLDVTAPLLITSDLASGFATRYPGFEFDPLNFPGVFEGVDPVATFINETALNDANDPFVIHADLAIAKTGNTILSAPLLTPEPSTIALLGGSLLGLVVLRRRRSANR
jgi:hypothetical protein